MRVIRPIKRVFIFFMFSCLVLFTSGCAKPYIQSPGLLGSNPAILRLHPEELKNDRHGNKMFSLYKSHVKCNGIGPANKEIINMGRFYDDTGATDILETEVKIPVDTKIIVQTFYSLFQVTRTETCDVSIQFQPNPSAEYLLITKREKAGGVFASAGKCFATLFEVLENKKAEEKVMTEVKPVVYGSIEAFQRQNLFCDANGSVLTEQEWEKQKHKGVDSLLYADDNG